MGHYMDHHGQSIDIHGAPMPMGYPWTIHGNEWNVHSYFLLELLTEAGEELMKGSQPLFGARFFRADDSHFLFLKLPK